MKWNPLTWRHNAKRHTVLAPANDPFRQNTRTRRKNAKWFSEQIERFLRSEQKIHLRGLHYAIVSAANVRKPDGKLYTNTNDNSEWLNNNASKAARWLGIVPFERIVDERNAPPEIYTTYPGGLFSKPSISQGLRITLPDSEDILPHVILEAYPKQPYRIIFIGEKTSLAPILSPLAKEVKSELFLPGGESSTTYINEFMARAAQDKRPSVVLYFSDFDPSGHQMAISVARKIQCLAIRKFDTLDIQVHPVALTLQQCIEHNLPESPLKPEEKRASDWKAQTGREQTEIDALAALQPNILRQIARNAVKPFFDFTLMHRTMEARIEWRAAAQQKLEESPHYQDIERRINAAYNKAEEAADELHAIQEEAETTLGDVELPEFNLPEADIEATAPKPLFTSEDDYFDACRKLIAHKDRYTKRSRKRPEKDEEDEE